MIDKEDYEFELNRLSEAVEILNNELKKNTAKMQKSNENMSDMLKYISSQFGNMDQQEKASMQLFLEEGDYEILELVTRDVVLKKQVKSPYFGRIDFRGDDEMHGCPYYIGISNIFGGENARTPFICDWRAPISSLYYDFEIGRGKYIAPSGLIEGEIFKKRQYKIEDGSLKYMFDSNLTIGDEILQATLSQTTDAKMKNIVATIQKEQNKIIRSEIFNTLIVQGIAGSGKTSIALHRVAFLLYKHKDKIKSKDILIISPNKIFSEYISSVLPELGEQNICETTINEIARDEFQDIGPVEERTEMLEEVIAGNTKRAADIKKKASFEFFDNIKKFLNEKIVPSFVAEDIIVGDAKVEKEKIQDLFFARYAERDVSLRIEYIADFITDEITFQNEGKKGVFSRVKSRLLKMFENTDILKIYERFLAEQGMTLSFAKSGKILHEDLAPIMFVKDFLIGVNRDKSVKYLLIDEMQDYTPIHFALFSKIYSCPKTVLGDIFQCVEKKLDEVYLTRLSKMFENGQLLILNKSYRSTIEIASFAQSIIGLTTAENVDRHGEKPEIVSCLDDGQIDERILLELKEFSRKGFGRVAVICKSDVEAKRVFDNLSGKIQCELLTKDNCQIEYGNIVTSSGLSKGLEFDAVIIPYADSENYKSEIERNILFISVTRALHDVKIIHSGKLTKFIQ